MIDVTEAPENAEVATLTRLFERQRERYANDPAAALQLTTVGLAPTDSTLNQTDHAAWTAIARVLLNLHETITRY